MDGQESGGPGAQKEDREGHTDLSVSLLSEGWQPAG